VLALRTRDRGSGTNQCVIWGRVWRLRDPAVWDRVSLVVSAGDKVRLEDRGGSPDSVCQNQIVEGDSGRARDKRRDGDRSGMCQAKEKMEGFM
jgi:hypothetical protein